MCKDKLANSYDISIVVRDYECDTQGIVNNSVYNNYFEHARNTLIKRLGASLYQLHKQGQTPVVARAEIDYVQPLFGGEECKVHTTYTSKGSFKLLFEQQIIKSLDNTLCTKAVFTVAVISNETQRPIAIKKSIFAKVL